MLQVSESLLKMSKNLNLRFLTTCFEINKLAVRENELFIIIFLQINNTP